LTRHALDLTICRMRGKHASHYPTDAGSLLITGPPTGIHIHLSGPRTTIPNSLGRYYS